MFTVEKKLMMSLPFERESVVRENVHLRCLAGVSFESSFVTERFLNLGQEYQKIGVFLHVIQLVANCLDEPGALLIVSIRLGRCKKYNGVCIYNLFAILSNMLLF